MKEPVSHNDSIVTGIDTMLFWMKICSIRFRYRRRCTGTVLWNFRPYKRPWFLNKKVCQRTSEAVKKQSVGRLGTLIMMIRISWRPPSPSSWWIPSRGRNWPMRQPRYRLPPPHWLIFIFFLYIYFLIIPEQIMTSPPPHKISTFRAVLDFFGPKWSSLSLVPFNGPESLGTP